MCLGGLFYHKKSIERKLILVIHILSTPRLMCNISEQLVHACEYKDIRFVVLNYFLHIRQLD